MVLHSLIIDSLLFTEHLDQIQRYIPANKKLMETSDSAKSDSYLELFLEIDKEGKLVSKIYDNWVSSTFLL